MAELLSIGVSRVMRDLRASSPATSTRSAVMNPQNQPALIGGAAGGFASARIDRITQDWSTARRSMDQELLNGLTRLRARARERALNSPIASKFLQMVRTNVVGAHGVKIEFKVEKQRKRPDDPDIFDVETNRELSRAWRMWCRPEFCTVHGNLSLQDVLNLWADAIGRDGDFLLKFVYLDKSVNPFGFALQLLDADQLNEAKHTVGAATGEQDRLGVRVDEYKRATGYWLYDGNPLELGYGGANCKLVPANVIRHSYIPRRAGQTRGYPLLAPVLWDMHMLDKYFDAELTAARIGASLLATIEQDGAQEYQGQGENPDGSAAIKLELGTIPILGQGQKLNNQTPEHPAAAFNPFVERSLRLIASGLGVAYHELGNDLASVNFSSGRLGRQEAIDYWMELQRKLIQDIIDPVLRAWMRPALLNGAINLQFAPDRYLEPDAVQYIPRRWDYVDPLKDVQADIDAIQNGLETHEGALARRGKNYVDVFRQLKSEQSLADELDLELGTDIRGDALSEVNDGAPAAPNTDGSSTADAAKPPAKKKGSGKKQRAEARRQARRDVLMAESG